MPLPARLDSPVVLVLEGLLSDYLAGSMVGERIELSRRDLEELRALGYIQ
jgi:hypothetical protein